MGLFIGIDVGGTFTDFLVMDGGEAEVFKVLSTPSDPSIGVIDGLEKIAASRDVQVGQLVPAIDRPHDQRLYDAFFPDRFRELLDILFAEIFPGLVPVRADDIDRQPDELVLLSFDLEKVCIPNDCF